MAPALPYLLSTSAVYLSSGVVPTGEIDAFYSSDARKWAEWADKQLAVLLFPNITRTFAESYQAFSYVQVRGVVCPLSCTRWLGAAYLRMVIMVAMIMAELSQPRIAQTDSH
jgi:hypothetical protein